MITWGDTEGKARIQAECDKRNKHVVKTHHMRWKPLFSHEKGWHPAFRPKGQIEEVSHAAQANR